MKLTTKVAIQAATEAGDLLSQLVSKQQNVRNKSESAHADIVTASDIQSEELIIKTIQSHFPDHAILSEETNSNLDPARHDHLWIVDPLDGTISFAAGLPMYSVSISYFHNQKPISSALYLASTKETLWCETGQGAFIEERRLSVNDQPLKNSVIALDQGIRTRALTMSKIAPSLGLGIRALMMIPGEAGNLGLVAKGNIQGLLCSHPQVWDYAAGIHLVQEAGGIVSDYSGQPYRWFTRAGHIACTPSVHEYILERTAEVAKDFS